MTTRRDFLTQIGRAGGFSAAFATMHVLGLMEEPSASTLDLAPNAGNGVRVAILGGGIAGLVSAYELGKAGFRCTVLEARSRPGGRNWTVRSGTAVEFTDGTRQAPDWGADSYLNAGPARLPSIHKTILSYCRELGVPLEVEVNTSRSTLMVNDKAFGGRPIEQRQVINDTRGHVSELLAKCVQQNALDGQLTKDDRDRVIDFLKQYGDLKPDLAYAGSARSGVIQLPGAGPITQELRTPLELHALLDAGFWRGVLFEEGLTMQATMFQPVGGMDRIPYAFAAKLGSVVQYRAAVKEIRRTNNGVRILYVQNDNDKAMEADYCVCALPISILKSIPNDFSPRIKEAMLKTEYADGFKIGWESKRFWETDFNIYGGISWVASGPIGLVWYPSAKLFSETGVLISGYSTEGDSPFSKLESVEAKLLASRAAVERLHPGYGRLLSKAVYINWGKIPQNLGSWVAGREGNQNNQNVPLERESSPTTDTNAARPVSYYEGPYKEFTQPDDRIYFAGDHCARLGAWQEGAALAAHRAAQMIGDRVRMTRLSARSQPG